MGGLNPGEGCGRAIRWSLETWRGRVGKGVVFCRGGGCVGMASANDVSHVRRGGYCWYGWVIACVGLEREFMDWWSAGGDTSSVEGWLRIKGGVEGGG